MPFHSKITGTFSLGTDFPGLQGESGTPFLPASSHSIHSLDYCVYSQGPNQVTRKVKDVLPANFIGPRQSLGRCDNSICFTDKFKIASFPWREVSTVKSCLYPSREIISNPLGDKSFLSFSLS